MSSRKYWAPFVAGLSCACGTLPAFHELGAARTDEIIEHIKCELQDAYRELQPYYPWLTNWIASYKLTYKADATNTGGLGSATWTIPGGVTIGGNAIVTRQGVRQGIVQYAVKFSDLQLPSCPSFDETRRPITGPRGNLGIKEWLTQALSSADDKNRPQTLGYSVSFVAKIDASLRPAFIITNLVAGGTVGKATAHTDTLDLAFVTPAGPTKVCVVDPNTGQCPAPARAEISEESKRDIQDVFRSLRPE